MDWILKLIQDHAYERKTFDSYAKVLEIKKKNTINDHTSHVEDRLWGGLNITIYYNVVYIIGN